MRTDLCSRNIAVRRNTYSHYLERFSKVREPSRFFARNDGVTSLANAIYDVNTITHLIV